MQVFTQGTWDIIYKYGKEPAVVVAIWGLLRRAYKKLSDSVVTHSNQIITANANRVRDELHSSLTKYIDDKFAEHKTECDDKILESIERINSNLVNFITKGGTS